MLTGEITNTKAGKKHDFALSVSDKKGNRASYISTLIY